MNEHANRAYPPPLAHAADVRARARARARARDDARAVVADRQGARRPGIGGARCARLF